VVAIVIASPQSASGAKPLKAGFNEAAILSLFGAAFDDQRLAVVHAKR
jgi:hypothetical protein